MCHPVGPYAFFQSQELIYGYSKSDTQIFHALALPAVTLSAFASELFLKCLVCIETSKVPQGHNLRKLFDLSSSQSRKQLCAQWDDYAPKRAAQWDRVEKDLGRKVARDLPSALSAGSRGFELLRYMYEDAAPPEFQFYLDDFPHMLGNVILKLKPEWETAAANMTVTAPSFK